MGFFLDNIRIGSYLSHANICQDGYSVSKSPVPGFDNSEVLARLNECQPLISSDGNYHNEILKSVFNIGLRNVDTSPLWITPNSIRQRKYTHHHKVGQIKGEVDPTSHRRFAALMSKDMNCKVDFANKYGLLRHHELHNVVFRQPDSGQQFQIGESLLWWQEEILDLSACLRLWDMIRSDDKELKHNVLWHRDGIVIKLDGLEVQLVNRATMNLMTKWTSGDVEGPARYYLSLEFERRLRNSLTPRVSDSQEHDISVYPDSLLSDIWLMFLLEVTGSSRLMQCVICGEYFNTNDSRSQFCSARCRMRKYRTRDYKIKIEKGRQGRLI